MDSQAVSNHIFQLGWFFALSTLDRPVVDSPHRIKLYGTEKRESSHAQANLLSIKGACLGGINTHLLLSRNHSTYTHSCPISRPLSQRPKAKRRNNNW